MIIIKRKVKLIIFVLVFIIASPIIILYANGDIFGGGWSLLKTGGIYISDAPVGSDIYLNSKFTNNTSFFDRNILIKSLKKGKYEVSVKKESYNTWTKKITVFDNLVSEANVFMLPNVINIREIYRYVLPNSGTPTSTITKSKNPEYLEILETFTKKTQTIIKTSSTSSIDFKGNLGTKASPIMDGKIGLWSEGGRILSAWFGNNDLAPRYFCDVSNCTKTIQVIDIGIKPTRLNFLPEYSGVAVIAFQNKIFAIQIEQNPEKVAQIIYKGNVPDLRIYNNILYIKDGNYIAEVLL